MIKKIIYIFIVFFIIMCSLNNNTSYARHEEGGGAGGTVYTIDPDYYTNGLKNNETTGTDKISYIGKTIIGLLRGAGTVISVIVIIAIGIKYIMGSVEEKATYKQTLGPYFIGAIMVFGITNILPIIIRIGEFIK